MLKNTAGQKVTFFVFNHTTGVPKTGDSANLSASVKIGNGATTLLADQTCEEHSDTLAKGLYSFNVSQAETNGDNLVFSCQSTTANIACVPQIIGTRLSVDATVGAGGTEVIIITNDILTGDPIDGVEVWITTDNDPDGNIVSGTIVSDILGKTKHMLDDNAIYYVWRQRGGYDFVGVNPEIITLGTP